MALNAFICAVKKLLTHSLCEQRSDERLGNPPLREARAFSGQGQGSVWMEYFRVGLV